MNARVSTPAETSLTPQGERRPRAQRLTNCHHDPVRTFILSGAAHTYEDIGIWLLNLAQKRKPASKLLVSICSNYVAMTHNHMIEIPPQNSLDGFRECTIVHNR